MRIIKDRRGIAIFEYLLAMFVIVSIAYEIVGIVTPSVSGLDTRMTDHIKSITRTGM